MTRTKAIPLVVCVFGLFAAVAIVTLQQRAATDRALQLDLGALRVDLSAMQGVPIQGMAVIGGDAEATRRRMDAGKRRATRRLADLRRRLHVPGIDAVEGPMLTNLATLDLILALRQRRQVTFAGRAAIAAGMLAMASQQAGETDAVMRAVGRRLDARATRADHRATAGAVSAIVLLLILFGWFYRGSVRARSLAEDLAHANARLALVSRREARTDALTGLGNRRALVDDLDEAARRVGDDGLIVALFDLDGFKQYNDRFGHPAGDALLVRLGRRVQAGLADRGTAYRMGGDEFCVLVPGGPGAAVLIHDAASALSDAGDDFQVGCSYGLAAIPAEAADAVDALRLADRRMYEDKAARASAAVSLPAA